jgi:hypothetical protein
MRLKLLLVVFVLQLFCVLTFGQNEETDRISAKKFNRLRKKQIIREMSTPLTNVDPPGKFKLDVILVLFVRVWIFGKYSF